jgi:hypothetical protein
VNTKTRRIGLMQSLKGTSGYDSTLTEFQIQKQIAEYLRKKNIPFFRTNVSYRKGQPIAKESVGVPDIVGVLPDGRFLGIEVKLPGKKPTLLQEAWIEAVNRHKGIAFIAYSVDDVIARV